MYEYLQYIFDDFFYTIVDALALGVALGIFIRVISLIGPMNSWKKIKENPTVSAIIWVTMLIIFGVFVISGYFLPGLE